MNESQWASFEVIFADGEKQTLCCDMSCMDATEQIIDFVTKSNAKLIKLVNFMSCETERLKAAKCRNGQSLFFTPHYVALE